MLTLKTGKNVGRDVHCRENTAADTRDELTCVQKAHKKENKVQHFGV